MRRLLAGLVILMLACTASADMRAEVESIGFNNIYRPDCWTPMVVRITPDKSGTFQLQVFQEDLDGDEPIFTQEITLTGSEEGTATEQRFWMYFIPQPTHGGLLDVNRGGTLKELNGQVRVMLADAKGKQLQKLPITSTIMNLEPPGQNPFSTPRGTKLVLAIGDGKSKLIWSEYEKALGILENVVMVPLASRDLPEDPRGFEAVDTIIWTNTEAPDPSSPTGERRMRALQKWVRGGGRLVICQPPERDRVLPWGDMLPVVVNEVTDKRDLMPLASFAMPRRVLANDPPDPHAQQIRRVWLPPSQNGYGPAGPFRVARAEAKPGTIVDAWIEWDPNNKADRTPYLVRMGYGLGSVTWVAQDLGDPAIVNKATLGWPNVWNRILGYNDLALTKLTQTPEKLTQYWDGGMGVDLYPSMMSGAELQGKSRAFVGLAIIFFVVYWLIAGPGIYLYLLAKARAYASWFAFGAAAIVATAVTVLVVQLVVRGDPELAHVSIVRKAAGDPAVIISRFGLYIPQDGPQEVLLRDTDPAGTSYVTALNKHPKYITDESSFLSFANYTVPVLQSGSGEPVAVEFPYRSTMRQMQARWTGIRNGGVEGGAKIVAPGDGYVSGSLTNGTGATLKNVYIAFNHPMAPGGRNDIVFYMPTWDNSLTIDLANEFKTNRKIVTPQNRLVEGSNLQGMPDRNEKVWGTLARDDDQWPGYWYERIRNNGIGPDSLDDSRQQIKKAFPMLSFFSRLPPVKNPSRIELLRRGQRQLDLGHALAAGELVVIAESADSPIPIPLDVDGNKVTGNGTTFYQFVLPLDHSVALESEESTEQQQATPQTVLEQSDANTTNANTGAAVERAPRTPNTGRRRIGGQPSQQQPQQQQQQPLLNPNG